MSNYDSLCRFIWGDQSYLDEAPEWHEEGLVIFAIDCKRIQQAVPVPI
jgi:hypothetical protein